MRVRGKFYKLETFKTKEGVDKSKWVLLDIGENGQAEECFFEVGVSGAEKLPAFGSDVTFDGRIAFFQNGRAGFQARGEIKVLPAK